MKIRKHILKARGEAGQILFLILIYMLLGVLILIPLLTLMGTGAKTARPFETKTEELYAADAGIQDALWFIESGKLSLVTGYDPFVFDIPYTYPLPIDVNNLPVSVSVRNEWVPTVSEPASADAQRIILGDGVNSPKVVVTGKSISDTEYRVRINYSRGSGDVFSIDSVGLWLPRGFSFGHDDNLDGDTTDTNEMVNLIDGSGKAWSLCTRIPYDTKGNQAVVFSWGSSGILFFNTDEETSDFDGDYNNDGDTSDPGEDSGFATYFSVAPSSVVLDVIFRYTPDQLGTQPVALGWAVPTSGLQDGTTNITVVWDADISVYGLSSTAGNTTVESYDSRSTSRSMPTAISGDYYAVGNSLLRNATNDSYHIRETWILNDGSITDADGDSIRNSSLATVGVPSSPSAENGIPLNANITAAYLYWTSWYHESEKTTVSPLDPGTASDFINGSAWTESGSTFIGHYNSGGSIARLLTLSPTLDLAGFRSSCVELSWNQAISEPTSTTVLLDNCDDFVAPPLDWETSGGVNYFKEVPSADGDLQGTWNTAPQWDDVDEDDGSIPINDSNYMTGTDTGASGNTGWLSPSANLALSGGDNNGFEMNPAYAYNDGSGNASNSNGTGDRHAYYNYNFSIPTGSLVSGIEVRLDWWLDTTSGSNNYILIDLSWDGGSTWTSYNQQTSGEPTSETTATLGSSSDTWGHSWTTTDLSNANFRVRLTCNSTDSFRDFRLDWVPVRITYSNPGYMLFTCSSQFSDVPTGTPISGLTVVYRAREALSGTSNIKAAIKVGGLIYSELNPGQDPGTSFNTYSYTFANNPKTGAPWTVNDIKGMVSGNELQQFGVLSTDLSPDVRVSMVYVQVEYMVGVISIWTASGNQFVAQGGSVTEEQRRLTMQNSLDLSSYEPGSITINWQQFEDGSLEATDTLYLGLSSNGGTSWTDNVVFSNDSPPANFIFGDTAAEQAILNNYLTPNFKMRLYCTFNDSTEFVRIDDIEINYTPQYAATDGLTFELSADNGTNYIAYPAFNDDDYTGDGDNNSDGVLDNFNFVIPSNFLTDKFRLRYKLDGFEDAGKVLTLSNIKLTVMVPDDSVIFKINGNQVSFELADEDGDGIPNEPQTGGQIVASPDNVEVIKNITSGDSTGFSYTCFTDVTSLVQTYTSATAEGYHPGHATYTVGDVGGTKGDEDPNETQLSHAGWSLILIYAGPTTLGHQLYLFDRFTYADDYSDLDFDDDNAPGATISGFIVPERIYGIVSAINVSSQGSGYSSGTTVSISEPDITGGTQATASAIVSSGRVTGITITNKGSGYTSAPAITITGTGSGATAIATVDTATGETNSAKLTVFVGEGDDFIEGDFIAFNAPASYWDTDAHAANIPSNYKLSDGIDTTKNNVWNSRSLTFSADGVDIDTFYIPWTGFAGGLDEGDTSAHIDIYTVQDNWNLVYIILSFRSSITSGGALSYLIKTN